jgi:hypothetical protein
LSPPSSRLILDVDERKILNVFKGRELECVTGLIWLWIWTNVALHNGPGNVMSRWATISFSIMDLLDADI